jgi:hypothetical protein
VFTRLAHVHLRINASQQARVHFARAVELNVGTHTQALIGWARACGTAVGIVLMFHYFSQLQTADNSVNAEQKQCAVTVEGHLRDAINEQVRNTCVFRRGRR